MGNGDLNTCILGVLPMLTFFSTKLNIFFFTLQLLAMDVSAQATMKDAAKCDKLCEWQNSANQQNAERILHFQVTPESMSESGRLYFNEANTFRLLV